MMGILVIGGGLGQRSICFLTAHKDGVGIW